MSEREQNEMNMMVESILAKLGHESIKSELATIKADIKHIGKEVDKLRTDFDSHSRWGVVENERNRVDYVSRKELNETYATKDIVDRVKKNESKIGRIEWFSFVTLLTVLGNILYKILFK